MLEAQSLNILIADDDAIDRRLYGQSLASVASRSCEIQHAVNGEQALAQLCEREFDCLLLDYQMPDMDGLEVLELAPQKTGRPLPPVIMLTGQERDEVAVEALSRGAEDYLVKGRFDKSSLQRAVRYAIERHRTRAELRESARRLKASEEQLLLAAQMKDRLLSHVSHELRTPLNAIYQFVTILRDGLAGDMNSEQHQYLGIAQRNALQLRNMISDLLDLSRATSGKLSVVPVRLDLTALIEDAVRSLSEAATAQGIDIQFEQGLRPDDAVLADPTRIRQVVLNLVENALKFTESGGSVRVTARPNPDHDGEVLVEVADTGRGMENSVLELVFDNLYQVENGTSSSRKGLGIGLHICRHLVQQHGGRIWAESRLGEGSRFFFTLPRFSLASSFDALQARTPGDLQVIAAELRSTSSSGGLRLPESSRLALRAELQGSILGNMDRLLPPLTQQDHRELVVAITSGGDAGAQAIARRVRDHAADNPSLASEDLQLQIQLAPPGSPSESLVERQQQLERWIESLLSVRS